ncbi:phospho-sugar mutase [Microscilla marina]|uniref:Phosphomannomutase, putative n=1 Tax=Microscilla marina ATCC 23134 TaxID=313606 RepID=A1ZX67_MICM2|nr:phospho-sugar mutase [Microscilla marina]EAY25048.1 phosphomannomutase, putative [Microscilla marina ATCC 23134]
MSNLPVEIEAKVEQWLLGNYDETTKNILKDLKEQNDTTTLVDAFYKDLEFGTGGLRGIMGVGSNRINKYTIGMATQGLANYLLQCFPNETIKVAIAHDSRNQSDYFAQITAHVFSANGIEVYFFDQLRPTPELSFAIRHLGCKSGVVLTASHNPKEYNGYKAYWTDGAQLVAPHDKNVIAEVQKIQVDDIKFTKDDRKIHVIGKDIDEVYLDKIKALSISPEAIKKQSDIKIVYTPIHGTGVVLVPQILEKMGFTNVHVLEAQATPDGNFPTVVYPNPEEAEALTLALAKAKELDADLVMATDPDTDRVGIALKNHHNEWQLINGNQTGALLVHYLLDALKNTHQLEDKHYIVKTIVTTELIDTMSASYGVDCFNTLTGFKHIASIIRALEGKRKFIGGGEESYGYMIGDFVRDKDAVASCAFLAEMTAVAKDQGKTLFDQLIDIYLEHGFYLEDLVSIKKEGKAGADAIKQMMEEFRLNPPKSLAGSEVITLKDYQSRTETNLQTGATRPIDLPVSNVLQFFTADGSKVSARPSGTEPKIKFYFGVKATLESREAFDEVHTQLKAKIEAIKADLNL